MKKTFTFFLSLVLLASAPTRTFAAYAQLKPPPGWSQGVGAAVPGQAGTFAFGIAANAPSFKGRTVLTNAALNVAGQYVTIPVSMRVAANAATVAAEWSFGNPLLFATALAAPFAYQWFKENSLVVKSGSWGKTGPVSDGYEYQARNNWNSTYTGPWYGTAQAAAADSCQNIKSQGGRVVCSELVVSANKLSWTAPYDTYYCTACSPFTFSNGQRTATVIADPTFTPIGLPEFRDIMAPKVLPDSVPKELPDVAWPVQLPVINPDPAIDPVASPAPAQIPRPLWVPTGDPVKNPNPDPANKPDTWTQPGQDVKPSGTPSDPWRIDVTSNPKTKTDSSPNAGADVASTQTPSPTSSELVTCGLPGKPKCQIDETGTPTYDPKKFELDRPSLDAASKTQRETVSSTTDKATLFTPWATFFTLPPLAACTPITMPVYAGAQIASLNVCPAAEWLRGLMGFVWAAVGFFFVFRTVQDAI